GPPALRGWPVHQGVRREQLPFLVVAAERFDRRMSGLASRWLAATLPADGPTPAGPVHRAGVYRGTGRSSQGAGPSSGVSGYSYGEAERGAGTHLPPGEQVAPTTTGRPFGMFSPTAFPHSNRRITANHAFGPPSLNDKVFRSGRTSNRDGST